MCQRNVRVRDSLFAYRIKKDTIQDFHSIHKEEKPTSDDLFTQLKKVIDVYETRGFNVKSVISDLEFESIRERLLPIELVTVAVDDHVGDVEQSICTSKECVRSILHGLPYNRLPYNRLPKVITVKLNREAMQSWNQLPANNGVTLGKPFDDSDNKSDQDSEDHIANDIENATGAEVIQDVTLNEDQETRDPDEQIHEQPEEVSNAEVEL